MESGNVGRQEEYKSSRSLQLNETKTQLFYGKSMSGLIDYADSASNDSVTLITPNQNTNIFNTFSDTECGEPMHPQHIVLDFTPTEADEDEQLRQKCLSFWEFFDSKPELQKYIVDPTPVSSEITDDAAHASFSTSPAVEPPTKKKTAMSFLEEFAEKDIFAGLLSCKMPGSGCSLGSREYHEHDPMMRGINKMRMRQPCRCIGTCSLKCRKRKKMTPPEIQLLSKNLNDWTLKNPKSMEPPGHAPELKHAVMQRRLEPVVPPRDAQKEKYIL